MKNLLRLAPIVVLLLASGCVMHHRPHPHGMPPGQAKKLGCSHHPGCGHVLVNGVWVTVTVGSTAPGPPGHVKNNGSKP